MTKKSSFLFFLFLIIPLISLAQNDTVSNKKPKSSIPDIEKVYLHTDRTYYTVGESLWYKAYCVYAYTNVLFDNSKILYVELLSPESKIISRNVTRLEEGLGHGDMILSDSIGVKPGTYQLRAYTNWMRNYGDDFVFKKEIQIIAPTKDNVDNATANNAAATPSKEKKNKPASGSQNIKPLRVDFFPEGGSLIENISGAVAFKATDPYGNPIEIVGTVFDSNGKTISTLQSSHDGMGKFTMTPEKNQSYWAEIKSSDNQQLKAAIPNAAKTGYALSMNIVNGKKIMTLKTNPETLGQKANSPLTLICSSRGVTYYEGAQAFTQTKLSFLLPEDELPEGIAQITILDNESKPQSERLVYIEKNKNTFVSMTPDKLQYAPKEKVTLSLSAKDEQGNPLLGSFSIASTDTNGMDNIPDNSINICSQFLMASDIKGKIHNPGYYFDLSNTERLPHLDLLLLTQGWRDFVWKKFPTLKESPDFRLEKGIKVSGKVKDLLSSSPKENSQVRIVLINNGKSMILDDTTDANGKFEFDNIVFTGNTTMLLNTQNEKGKNRGMFILDSIYHQALPTDFRDDELLKTEKIKIAQFKENIHSKNVLFNIPEANRLNDITITSKKKKTDTGPSRYGFADYTYIPEEKGPHYSTIFLLIQIAIPNVSVSGNSIRFNRYNGPALVLVDGVETDMDLLSSISTDDIAKMETIKGPGAAVFGSQGANGALLIYTKEGSISFQKTKVFHSISQLITGYQNARFFYSPDYSDPKSSENEKADIRNTLYWNPYVQPDKDGNAQISYYNSEVNTKVKVTLEGMTSNGIPVVVKTGYSIKK
jgi:hypothetical protein